MNILKSKESLPVETTTSNIKTPVHNEDKRASGEFAPTEKKIGDNDTKETLDTLPEVNETSEMFDRPQEIGTYLEIPPKIFGSKDVKEPLTIPYLDNAIYELGVVNLCWPKIIEPVFETRKSFPPSYYTNSNKERLVLAYAENFRRQFLFHHKFRKPLLLQCLNECGLQVVSWHVSLTC